MECKTTFLYEHTVTRINILNSVFVPGVLHCAATACVQAVCGVCSGKWMALLPVVELLWSSPGIHFSFTLLSLCSDSTKFSGASGTSKKRHDNIALVTHKGTPFSGVRRTSEKTLKQSHIMSRRELMLYKASSK